MKKVMAFLIGCMFALPISAQGIKQYSGEYPKPMSSYWYGLDPTAVYSYYDAPGGYGRIFHGPFKLKFHGEGSTSKKIIFGSIAGNFKDDYQDGEWTMIYPIHILSRSTPFSRRQRTGTFKCKFVNGRMNGEATYVVKENATGKIMLSQKVRLVDGVLDGPFESVEAEDGRYCPAETVKGLFKNGERAGIWNIEYDLDQYFMEYDGSGDERGRYIVDHRTGDKSEYGYVLPHRNATSGIGILDIISWFPMRKSAKIAKEHTDEVAVKELEPAPIEDNNVYTAVEERPTFPGGEAALMKYIADHICYPPTAQENNIQGRVIVQFVVTKTGKVGEVKVVRGKDPDLDREAERVVRSLPDFIPGKMNGQPVNVWETVPVTFKCPEH
jgi:tonB family C-terminal domain